MAIFSSIGNVGLDVHVHHLINAGGGKSSELTIQKIGRGLRRAEDKARLHYHDFFFENSPVLVDHSVARLNTLKLEGHHIQWEPDVIPTRYYHDVLEEYGDPSLP